MAVGVDEAGNDDPMGGVDDRGGLGRRCDVGRDLADLAVLDQHVSAHEVADFGVERQDHAAPEHDAARTLEAAKLGVAGTLGSGLARKEASGCGVWLTRSRKRSAYRLTFQLRKVTAARPATEGFISPSPRRPRSAAPGWGSWRNARRASRRAASSCRSPPPGDRPRRCNSRRATS